METKTQNPLTTHPQAYSNSRPQSHTCDQCHCSHHCRNCSPSCSRSQSCSRSRSCSQSPTGHVSPPVHQSQTPSPSLSPRHHKHTMHSHRCPTRPTTHSYRYTKNRKNLGGKVNKRKVVKRRQQVYRTKRRSSGRKYN